MTVCDKFETTHQLNVAHNRRPWMMTKKQANEGS